VIRDPADREHGTCTGQPDEQRAVCGRGSGRDEEQLSDEVVADPLQDRRTLSCNQDMNAEQPEGLNSHGTMSNRKEMTVPEHEKLPLDFPGFLRTNEGGYVKLEDFLVFVDRAAGYANMRGTDRAHAWMRRRGVNTNDLATLSAAEVSRLLAAAQEIIQAQHTKERRTLPAAALSLPNGSAPEADGSQTEG